MLFSLRSIALLSASIAALSLVNGSVAVLPPVPADPVVMDDPFGDPDELAVPALLVPGGWETLAGLPAPLGSLPELLSPPTLAGPDGAPLTPAVPAPAEPALGEPAALPVPDDGPLAAPPALPPLAPPELCANELTGNIKMAIAATAAAADALVMWNLPFVIQRQWLPQVPYGSPFTLSLGGGLCRNVGLAHLIGPVLDHAHKEVRFAVRATDLKPPYRPLMGLSIVSTMASSC